MVKKGFSAADVANGAMIFMILAVVFSALYFYITMHGRTELFTSTSRIYEYSYYSTSAKMFLRDATKYSYEQSSGDEEKFKTVFSAYLSELTKNDARITNSPKIESVSFDSDNIFVKLDKPLMLGGKDSYVLVDNRIYCNGCIS